MSNPDNTGAAAPGTGSAPTTSAAPATDEVRTTIVDDSHVPPTFAELGVDPQIVEALIEDGKAHTFAIQELTLPLAMAGDDLIGQARTGMGKTFGFGVPLLHRLANADAAGIRSLDTTPRALIIVPTRELCIQVTGDIELAAKKVTRAGAEVHLTPTEWGMLEMLVRNRGKLVGREELLKEVWGPAYAKETHYLRVYLAQLRRKLEDDPSHPKHLLTESGMGYRFQQ